MPDAVIENPILNSPFQEPAKHFVFGESGITSQVAAGRRISSYFMPIPAARRTTQLPFDADWTRDRLEENRFINRIRQRIGPWRRGGWQGATSTSRRLLHYWAAPERDRKLFFCQLEALETAIYIAEIATHTGDAWILNSLQRCSTDANPGLFRVALKMATGSGKTVVMAMLIAWQTLNRLDRRQDARFSDTFLIVAPGITIRDRLRVLLPHDLENYYLDRDLVSHEDLARLASIRRYRRGCHAACVAAGDLVGDRRRILV